MVVATNKVLRAVSLSHGFLCIHDFQEKYMHQFMHSFNNCLLSACYVINTWYSETETHAHMTVTLKHVCKLEVEADN